MQRFLLYLILFFLPAGYSPTRSSMSVAPVVSECQSLYEEMCLQGVVNYAAFQEAFAGYNKLEVKNKDIITLIDFTRPSTEERFYVLDLKSKKSYFLRLFHTVKIVGKIMRLPSPMNMALTKVHWVFM